jgi:hypothetical protein
MGLRNDGSSSIYKEDIANRGTVEFEFLINGFTSQPYHGFLYK